MTARNYINLTAHDNLSWADLLRLAQSNAHTMPNSSLSVGVSPAQSEELHATWHDEVSATTPAPPTNAASLKWSGITIRTLPARECLSGSS